MQKWEGSQRRIGITGSIASGKTSVGKYLQEIKGYKVLDADLFAREILSPGGVITEAVIKRFGENILKRQDANKIIDRKILSDIIFNNKSEKLWLESLIHPIIKKRLEEELYLSRKLPLIVLIIPLLFEAGLTSLCSEIWVVSCNEGIQLNRLSSRDKFTRKDAEKRIQGQWPLKLKEQLADKVIYNNGSINKLEKQIEQLL